MVQKKTIAIIGATSKRGSAIVKTLAKGNYHLLLMSEETERLSSLINELLGATAEIEAMSCAKDACWEADIIVVATADELEKEIAEKIEEVAIGKIVISVSSPIDSTYRNLFASDDDSAAEMLQRLLPYSKVVKTFNTTYLENFTSPVIQGKTADTFIAGNNSDAIETVSELVRLAGFNPFVVGDLSMSRALERMQVLLDRKKASTSFNWFVN